MSASRDKPVDETRTRGGFRQPSSPAAIIAAIAGAQHGRITTRQLLEAGLTEKAIEHRVATQRLHREHRGVYCVGFLDTSQIGRFMAAVLACGQRAVLSHRCAAILLGLLKGVAPGVHRRHRRWPFVPPT